MANLGNLIVRGVTRILGDAYANKFIGNLQGNADTATSAIKASTADSATSATSANKASIATAVQDYGTSDYREIKIGYLGNGLSSSDITHAVGFTDSGTKIKDISKDEFRNWLATASGTWPITVSNATNAWNAEYANHLNVTYGNEFRFGNISSDQTTLWFNYANPDGTQNNVSRYYFGDGKNGTNSTIYAAQFTGNANTATNASAVNGISLTWDGEITSSQWIAAWESETSIRTMSAYNTFISMCSYLDEGSSDVTDGTMFITSYATDNGFDDPNGKNKPYKRKASLLWNYINNKCSNIYATQSWVNNNFYTCYESDNRYIQSETDPVWTAAKGNYYTKTESNNKFQPKGTYLTEQNLQGYATTTWVNDNFYTYSESDNRYIRSETDPVWTAAKGNYYTKNECDNRYIQSEIDPIWIADKGNYYTKTECNNKFQLKGTYLTNENLQGYATQEWVRGEEYLYRSGGTMDARAEIGITTKLFIGNSTSSDTCYTKFNCILHGGGDESNPNWVIRDNGYSEFKSSVSANSFYASSDIRLKNILDDINIDFDKLKLIPKKYYTWKGSDILQLGTIAQDIQKIYPEVVSKNENGYLSVDYSKLSIIALAAIDKLNERIKELECQIKL